MGWLEDNFGPQFTYARTHKKKSLWPHPNTNRVNARFRQFHGAGKPYPRPSRFVFSIKPINDFGQNNGFLDLDVDPGDPDVLIGASGYNVDDRQMSLAITVYEDGVDPIHGLFGIEYRWTYDHKSGGDTFFFAWLFPVDTPPEPDPIPFDVEGSTFGFTLPTYYFTNYVPFGHPTWPSTEGPRLEWFGVSECLSLDDVTPPDLQAEIRVPDAWIQNDGFTPATTGFWRAQYDIRMPVNAQTFILTNSITGTHWLGQLPTRAQWGNQSVLFDTPLSLDVWYHIDFRYQWDATDGLYRVSVDGGPETTNPGANQNLFFNRYGKRNGLPVEQNFDLKNFLFEHGSASSSVVILDQKLQVNACDDGPGGHDGTTFNMTLPSCPP